jgi:MFS transporter, AAHS family, 4-hydroxybenzoate transporter
MAGTTVDISEIIDGQNWRGFLPRFLGLLALMAIFDGYDLGCMAFAAPSILREWQVDKATFGVVLAAVTFGSIIGSFTFGLISDYWGRKRTAVTALLVFGVTSLVTVRATDVNQLMALRLLTGIGLGGLMPMLLTMAVEFAPQRLRSSIAMLAVIGLGFGITSAGFVGATLVPDHGWHIIFWIAGIGPIAIALLAYLALPESPRFLLSRERPAEQIAAVLRRLDPSFVLPAGAAFTDRNKIVETGEKMARVPASLLFRGRLARITLLLWAAYFVGTITPALVVTWVPTLGEGLGVEPGFAALSVTIGGFGLIGASLVMMPLLRRFGFIAIPIWTLITVPPLVIIGLTPVSNIEFVVLFVLIGIGGGASQGGTNAMVGQFYPDECRGTGISWAQMVSRVGGVLGPLVAGALLSRGVTVSQLFLLMAVPVLLFVICAFLLSVAHRRQLCRGASHMVPRIKDELSGGIRASP